MIIGARAFSSIAPGLRSEERIMSTVTLTPIEIGLIESQVVEAAKSVYDPEIPVNIYELGLIYDVKVDDQGLVQVAMTLTAPGCPAAGSLPLEVEDAIRGIGGVSDVKLDLVWDPPWSIDRMSDEAKLELGLL